jgi:hypothetical protein
VRKRLWLLLSIRGLVSATKGAEDSLVAGFEQPPDAAGGLSVTGTTLIRVSKGISSCASATGA